MNLEMNDKIQKIHDSVADFGALIGPAEGSRKIEGLDVAPGLGMNSDVETFETHAENIRRGVFNVLFMGDFKNGKSTTINAVIGKEAVPVKTTACTGIITLLVYGSDTDHATVCFTDDTKPEVLDLKAFFNKYQIKPQDQDEIDAVGYAKRFANVKHAIIECDHNIVKNGVKIIDSPGLSESVQADKTTENFVPSANVIVFLLMATKPYSKGEKDYIRKHFANKQLRNVFFLVNRINQITDSIEVTMENTEHMLKTVFTDNQGKFDRKLFDSRVFYVNSYGAFKGKQGGAQSAPEDTGIPAFERELAKFLSSDERTFALFQSVLTGMANTYKNAAALIEGNAKARSLPLAELENNHKLSLKRLSELESVVRSIEKTIAATSTIVQNKVISDLTQYVANDIPKLWDEEVTNSDDLEFGMGEVLRIAGKEIQFWKRKEDRDAEITEVCQPLADYIEKFITEKLNGWSTRIDTLVFEDIQGMQNEVSADIASINSGLREVRDLFVSGVVINSPTPPINVAQLIIAILMQDYSMIIEGAAGSQKSWGEFTKKIVIHLAVYGVLVSLFTGGLGIIAIIVAEVIQFRRGAGDMKNKLLDGMRSSVLSKLNEQIRETSDSMKLELNSSFTKVSNMLASNQRQLIAEEKAREKEIIDKKSSQQLDADAENRREAAILLKMFSLIDVVYSQVYGKPLAKSDIDSIAAAVH